MKLIKEISLKNSASYNSLAINCLHHKGNITNFIHNYQIIF